jgi:hypothetical protein
VGVPTFGHALLECCNNPTAFQKIQIPHKNHLSKVTLVNANSAHTVLYFSFNVTQSIPM